MGLKFKDIINIVTDIIPFGTVVKTLGKGVGALLTRKVAKATGMKPEDIETVLIKTQQEIEGDQEIKRLLIADAKEERKHELDFYGSFGDLDTGSQKLRARVRPVLSLGLIGLFMLYGLVSLFEQCFPYLFGMEFLLVFPPALVTISLAVVGFWFGGRTIEKVASIFKMENNL